MRVLLDASRNELLSDEEKPSQDTTLILPIIPFLLLSFF